MTTRREKRTRYRAVWTRLPVSLLTSSGQVHVTFTTAFSVFSRREDNAEFFICILLGKGKKYFFRILKSFFRYTASVLKVLDFRQTSLLDEKLPFVGDAALSCFSPETSFICVGFLPGFYKPGLYFRFKSF